MEQKKKEKQVLIWAITQTKTQRTTKKGAPRGGNNTKNVQISKAVHGLMGEKEEERGKKLRKTKKEAKWPGTEANISASPSLLKMKQKSLQLPRRGEEHAISFIENIQSVGEI